MNPGDNVTPQGGGTLDNQAPFFANLPSATPTPPTPAAANPPTSEVVQPAQPLAALPTDPATATIVPPTGAPSVGSEPTAAPPKSTAKIKLPWRQRRWFQAIISAATAVAALALISAGYFLIRRTSHRLPSTVDQQFAITNLPADTLSQISQASNANSVSAQVALNGDLVINGSNGNLNITSTLSQLVQGALPTSVTPATAAALAAKVNLQAAAPGTAQTGNINVGGNVTAGNFTTSGNVIAGGLQGNGSGLTGLNGSNIVVGTVADTRLSGNVALLNGNQTFTGSNHFTQSLILQGGNGNSVSLNAGSPTGSYGLNLPVADGSSGECVQTNGAGQLSFGVCGGGSGTITGVTAGAGLTGGGTSGNVTLAVDSTVTRQGNSFNGVSQLVQLDGSGNLPALNGSALTSLNASNVSTGTLNNSRLNNDVALTDRNNQSFTGNNQTFRNTVDSTTGLVVQDAAGANVLGVDTSNALVTIGQPSALTGKLVFYTTGGAGSVAIQGPATASNFLLTLPTESGTICTSAGTACAATFAPTTGSGSYIQNQIASTQTASFKINGTGEADTSILTALLDTPTTSTLALGSANASSIALNQNTTVAANKTLTANGEAIFKAATNDTTAVRIQNASAVNLLTADTVNLRVAIGSGAVPANGALTIGTNSVTAAGGLYFGTDTDLYRINPGGLKTDNFLVVQPSTNFSNAFNVATAAGETALNVDTLTNNGNLLTNGSFESPISGNVVVVGNAIGSQTQGNAYIGSNSLQVSTTTSGDGIKLPVSGLANSTSYNFAYQAISFSGTPSLSTGYSDDGVTFKNCSNLGSSTSSLSTSGWIKVTCTFTTGTVSGSPFVYFRQPAGDNSAHLYYVDAAIVSPTANNSTTYTDGTLQLNGVVTSPATFRNATNSTTAFRVQNAAGLTLLTGNTLSNYVTLGTGTALATADNGNGNTDALSIHTGNAAGGTSGDVNIAAGSGSSLGAVNIGTTNTGAVNIGNAFITTTVNGAAVFQNAANSTTAFQIQNASGVPLLNANDSTGTIGIAKVTGSLSSAPTLTASASGGTLATNTYFYKVAALGTGGSTISVSPEASVAVTGPSGSVKVTWSNIQNAASYNVYRGTSAGGENLFYQVSGTYNGYIDTNASPTGNAAPAAPTTGYGVSLGALSGSNGISASGATAGTFTGSGGFLGFINNGVSATGSFYGIHATQVGGTVITNAAGVFAEAVDPTNSGVSGYGLLAQSAANSSALFQTSNTSGTNTSPTVVVKGNTSQGADLFQTQYSDGTVLFSISSGGRVASQVKTDTAGAFSIQNAGGFAVFSVDTTTTTITIGVGPLTSYLSLGSSTANIESAITKSMACVDTSINVHDVVVIDSASHVAQTTTAANNHVMGVVVSKSTGTCKVAIAGLAQVNFATNATPTNIGDPVETSTVAGAAESTTTPTAGAILGHSTSAKDGSNLVYVILR